MGVIYKITNTLNDKVYIGQTELWPEKRWREHKRSVNYPYMHRYKLCSAMLEHGVENFTFDILEEVANSDLDDREQYYIALYNSFWDGYNGNTGGEKRKGSILDSRRDEVIEKYHELKSARKVALFFGVDHSTVNHFLQANNIELYSHREKLGVALLVEKNGEIISFNSINSACDYFVEQGITQASDPENVRPAVRRSLNTGSLYYGHKITKQE